MAIFEYHLVDVFTSEALSGNGLTIFQLCDQMPSQFLQRITQEMRQFESIFLWRTTDPHSYRARIFTMEEELGFAGHPIIGAACVLHAEHFATDDTVRFQFQLPEKTVHVISQLRGKAYQAEMDQGRAYFRDPIAIDNHGELLSALNLVHEDLMEGLPLQVVSTGLPYLIVPIKTNLANARIVRNNFESLLAQYGAKFVFILDVPSLEGRTWDNDGRVEDIATGSAAGPAGAFLVAHKLAEPDTPLVIHQGSFLGRSSELTVVVHGESAPSVRVSGGVVFVGRGYLDLPAGQGKEGLADQRQLLSPVVPT